MVQRLIVALEPDEVVIGGGNAKKLKELPHACRPGDNINAFLGGFRLWEEPRQATRAVFQASRGAGRSRNSSHRSQNVSEANATQQR
jgi:polyphosphate glucokinase